MQELTSTQAGIWDDVRGGLDLVLVEEIQHVRKHVKVGTTKAPLIPRTSDHVG